ncbi:MAG: sensor domain-containing diguanylate cyclase [Desulfosudis oleivorans]|nr:sensor domain-containing diguanylate cyclase [Desulfosudis oleivorans]
MCGKVARKKEALLCQDLKAQKDHVYFSDSDPRKGSYLGVPLSRPDGRLLGVLNAHKPAVDGFSDADVRLFKAVAEQVAVAIDHALTFQQTQELMSRDELTNLHNRRYFFERFEREVYRAKRYGRTLSLIMIDIDHFKNFNDRHGHLRGDQALKTMARTLEVCLRKADIIARYGGEEFLILLPETTKEQAARAAEKLRKKWRRSTSTPTPPTCRRPA